jgi:hypothetical protein
MLVDLGTADRGAFRRSQRSRRRFRVSKIAHRKDFLPALAYAPALLYEDASSGSDRELPKKRGRSVVSASKKRRGGLMPSVGTT